MATVPLAGWVIAVMVRVSSGSGSVSLPNTLIGLAVRALGHGGGVIDGDRGVVDVGDDVEGDGGGVGVRAAEQQTGQAVEVQGAGVVADLDGELIGTGVALVGVVGERSGGLIDGHRAVLRAVDAAVLEHLVLQGIAVGVGGVERDRDADLGWTEDQGDVAIGHHRRLVEEPVSGRGDYRAQDLPQRQWLGDGIKRARSQERAQQQVHHGGGDVHHARDDDLPQRRDGTAGNRGHRGDLTDGAGLRGERGEALLIPVGGRVVGDRPQRQRDQRDVSALGRVCGCPQVGIGVLRRLA